MKRVMLGSVVAALLMFFWGFFYWGGPLALSYQVLQPAPNQEALAKTLDAALPASGAYLLPHPKVGAPEESQRLMKAGPIVQINITKGGADPMDASVFLLGFLHMLVSAFLMALVLWMAAPAGASFAARFQIAALAGLAAACYSNLGKPIWWHQAWPAHLLYFGFDLGSWLLAALALAWLVRE